MNCPSHLDRFRDRIPQHALAASPGYDPWQLESSLSLPARLDSGADAN
jgi:hypothetical protein